jgi:hypothetical protein
VRARVVVTNCTACPVRTYNDAKSIAAQLYTASSLGTSVTRHLSRYLLVQQVVMVRDVLSSSAQARGELAAQYTALYIDDLHKLTPAFADVELRLLSSYGTVPITGTLLSSTGRVLLYY